MKKNIESPKKNPKVETIRISDLKIDNNLALAILGSLLDNKLCKVEGYDYDSYAFQDYIVEKYKLEDDSGDDVYFTREHIGKQEIPVKSFKEIKEFILDVQNIAYDMVDPYWGGETPEDFAINSFDGISILANLKTIDLDGGFVAEGTDLNPIKELKKIESIDISNYKIKSLDFLTELPLLKKISISSSILPESEKSKIVFGLLEKKGVKIKLQNVLSKEEEEKRVEAEKAIEIFNNKINTYQNLGTKNFSSVRAQILEELLRFSDEIWKSNKSIKKSNIYKDLAHCYFNMGKYEQAISQIEQYLIKEKKPLKEIFDLGIQCFVCSSKGERLYEFIGLHGPKFFEKEDVWMKFRWKTMFENYFLPEGFIALHEFLQKKYVYTQKEAELFALPILQLLNLNIHDYELLAKVFVEKTDQDSVSCFLDKFENLLKNESEIEKNKKIPELKNNVLITAFINLIEHQKSAPTAEIAKNTADPIFYSFCIGQLCANKLFIPKGAPKSDRGGIMSLDFAFYLLKNELLTKSEIVEYRATYFQKKKTPISEKNSEKFWDLLYDDIDINDLAARVLKYFPTIQAPEETFKKISRLKIDTLNDFFITAFPIDGNFERENIPDFLRHLQFNGIEMLENLKNIEIDGEFIGEETDFAPLAKLQKLQSITIDGVLNSSINVNTLATISSLKIVNLESMYLINYKMEKKNYNQIFSFAEQLINTHIKLKYNWKEIKDLKYLEEIMSKQ